MIIAHNGTTENVVCLKDCLELIEPELAEVIEEFIENTYVEGKDYDSLSEEFENYQLENPGEDEKAIVSTYDEFEKLITEHKKDMRRQIKSSFGMPKKVIVYKENDECRIRYEY